MSNTNHSDRRKSQDRRTRSERRRGGEGRHVVLHLCRSKIHLGLIVRDADGAADLLHTASIDWRDSEGAGDPLPGEEALRELTAHLKQLVTQQRVAGSTASLVLNSDLTVTRSIAGSTSEVDRALDECDERGQLYLALGPGAKMLVPSRANLDARHEQAVVTIACQELIQVLIKAVDAVGLELRFIEAETVALARAHGVLHPEQAEPAILVQFDNGGFEIAVAHRGNLLLDYRPGGRSANAGVAKVLAQHHSRLQRFCQNRLGDYKLQLRKVYLAGEPQQVEPAAKLLAKSDAFDAAPLDIESANRFWNRSSDRVDTRHAVLLGSVLKEIGAAAEGPAPNLMARWIAESRKHVRPILLRSALPIAATLLVAAILAGINWHEQSVREDLGSQIAALEPAHLEHKQLRLDLIASQEKLKRLQQLAEGAPPPDLTGSIAAIGGCLPDDVWLARLSIADQRDVKLTGASYSESGVYDFVRYLNVAPALEQVALEGTGLGHTQQGPSTTFDLKFKLSPDKLTPGGASSPGVAAQ